MTGRPPSLHGALPAPTAHRPPTTVRLPPTFSFSQHALQCYCDCPRRFWLSHIRRLPWPAIEAAPARDHERRLRQGAHFHRAVERALRGLPGAVSCDDPDVERWLAAWHAHAPRDLSLLREVEQALCAPLAIAAGTRVRLVARYDLIAVEPRRRAVIVDWKTGRGAPADPLGARLQSLLYPWLLVEASPALPWGPILPEQVEMRYWFAGAPCDPFVLRYNSEQHATATGRLRFLLADILSRQAEDEFPPAADCEKNRSHLCAYCIYRSRCGRGDTPGPAALFDAHPLPVDEIWAAGAAIPLSL